MLMELKKIEKDFISLQHVLRITTVDRKGIPHRNVCHAVNQLVGELTELVFY